MTTSRFANRVTFFVSTGRCGTQFFADKLSAHYDDLACVAHEPLSAAYRPRHYFNSYHEGQQAALSPALQQHVRSIEDTLEHAHYLEAGWPVYGVLPRLLRRFDGRVNIVHLYRHPVRVAASLSTHNVYRREDMARELSIAPTDRGVVQSHLAGSTWSDMSEFEKCLFWWTEINHFALRLRGSFPSVPWLSLRFEDVFCDKGERQLEKLLAFLDLPARSGFLNSLSRKTDRHSRRTKDRIDIDALHNYPATLQLMEELGYAYDAELAEQIQARYSAGGLNRLRRLVQRPWVRGNRKAA